MENKKTYLSITFYKYVNIENPEEIRDFHRELMLKHNIKGKIILAKEGINGAICGKEKNCEYYLSELKEISEFSDLTWRTTISETPECFKRTLVKIRPEIVPLGVEGITPQTAGGGNPLKPEELKEWYENKEDFVIIDARNRYEADDGKFAGAIIPPIDKFRDFASYVETIPELKQKKVVMYCTGGVRCEKASAFMKSKGFENVYKLDGGVIEFLKVAGDSNFFEGKLFVFDNRGKVGAESCCVIDEDD